MSRPTPATAALALLGALFVAAFALGGLSRALMDRPAHAMRAAASRPVQIGQAGDCPLFQSRGSDGSDIFVVVCRPGASPKERAK